LRGIGVDRRDHPPRLLLRGRRRMSSGSNALGGKVWKFGDNINTDLMLPGPWLYRSAEEQAKAVFINNRPEFLREMKQGDVIIGGFNYGMGSSRPAARSLRNCGVGFLLAEALNGLFFRNCVNFGFRAFECPGVSKAFEEGDRAELSIDDWTATNTRTGQTLAVTPVHAMLLEMMLGGGVLPMLEAKGLIAARKSA
jgi:3-isopropylmalate/(R)-2-methylmalate dehydratase small subunit